MKYQELIDYYNRIAEILRDRLPFVPGLQLSNAKTYYGSYWRKEDRSTLTLSYITCYPINHEELIDIITHELAHLYHYEHGRQHDVVKEHFKEIVNRRWNIRLISKEVANVP